MTSIESVASARVQGLGPNTIVQVDGQVVSAAALAHLLATHLAANAPDSDDDDDDGDSNGDGDDDDDGDGDGDDDADDDDDDDGDDDGDGNGVIAVADNASDGEDDGGETTAAGTGEGSSVPDSWEAAA